jgi:hypothetical protein
MKPKSKLKKVVLTFLLLLIIYTMTYLFLRTYTESAKATSLGSTILYTEIYYNDENFSTFAKNAEGRAILKKIHTDNNSPKVRAKISYNNHDVLRILNSPIYKIFIPLELLETTVR